MDANKIGAFIKELRTQKNMTQKDLAEIINCTDKAISRWETGRGVPEVSLLMPLSKALDVSVNELLTGERFIPEQKSEEQDQYEDLVMVPVIIGKSDETIVNVIKEKDEEIKSINKNKWIFMILCCAQVLIFFVIPNIITMFKPTAEPVLFLIYASVLNFVFVGLIKDKIKWLFPLFTAFCLLAPLITENSEGFLNFWYAAIFGVIGAVVIAVVTGVWLLLKKLFR